jgi:hypothetical protein
VGAGPSEWPLGEDKGEREREEVGEGHLIAVDESPDEDVGRVRVRHLLRVDELVNW